MKYLAPSMVAVVLTAINPIFSQNEIQLTAKDSVVLSSWVVGLGYNFVDDSATPFGNDFLNIKDTWHAVPYPSRVSVGRFFKSGIGLEAIGSYNKYKVGKKVDGNINTVPREYYALDGKISYDLNKLVGETGWFDPFLHVGAGYSSIGGAGRTTANAGFGFNTWFSDRWGLNFSTMGKWGIPKGSTKQLQHSAGVVYRFGIEKGLSRKGEAKNAMIEAMEAEQQRLQDSIATADRAREAALLAERLEQERLQQATAERERQEAVEHERKKVQDLADLAKVHYRYNSSSLQAGDKPILNELVAYMKKYPETTIHVNGHADSRGAAKYNELLSLRRAESVRAYVLSEGIAVERLVAHGFGESQITNGCVDGVSCSAEQHKVNRRVAYSLE